MITTEILGNIASFNGSLSNRRIDYVVFDNESRVKRIQRVATESGEEVGVRLGSEVREICDGDILVDDGQRLIVAKVAPTDVLVIEPKSIKEALEVAHSLGNRHLQAQFFDEGTPGSGEVMVVRYDHTVEHHLEHLGVRYYRGDYVMPKAFRHAEHTH